MFYSKIFQINYLTTKLFTMKCLKILALIFMSQLLWMTNSYSQKNDLPHDAKRTTEIINDIMQNVKGESTYEKYTAEDIYGVGMHMDSIFEVIYKPASVKPDLSNIVRAYSQSKRNYDSVLSKIRTRVNTSRSSSVSEINGAPILYIKTTDFELINWLKSNKEIFSVSPAGIVANPKFALPVRPVFDQRKEDELYDKLFGKSSNARSNWFERSLWGCENEKAEDVNVLCTKEGAIIPWHYVELGIPCANEEATGRGKKIALLDSGVSPDQSLFGNNFDDDYPGRTIDKEGTFSNWHPFQDSDGVDDDCGHGTHMAGVIASPNKRGYIRGVAYECDFLSVRVTDDVYINTSAERSAVTQALFNIANGASGYEDVDIISMSLGCLSYVPSIAFGVFAATSQGILMFSAAGTAPEWAPRGFVIFPAYLPSTIAVTGVYKGFPNPQRECDRCHYGGAVDFVVPMQDGDATTHSTTMSGASPSQVGGSSIATATMAGVAGAYWSAPANQNKSSTQIFNDLRNSATWQTKRPKFGYGKVDLQAALNAECEEELVDCNEVFPCQNVVCPPGKYCHNGNCIPLGNEFECINGICPQGYECEDGQCILDEGVILCNTTGVCPHGYSCLNGVCVPQ